jgi:hypothetical protein
MKKLLILLFSILISFNSHGEWQEIYEDYRSTYFIDTDRIKERDGYVYYHILDVFSKDLEEAYGTSKIERYFEGDCVVYRYTELTGIWYKVDGKRNLETYNSNWKYPFSDSRQGRWLNYVCDYVD